MCPKVPLVFYMMDNSFWENWTSGETVKSRETFSTTMNIVTPSPPAKFLILFGNVCVCVIQGISIMINIMHFHNVYKSLNEPNWLYRELIVLSKYVFVFFVAFMKMYTWYVWAVRIVAIGVFGLLALCVSRVGLYWAPAQFCWSMWTNLFQCVLLYSIPFVNLQRFNSNLGKVLFRL